MNWFDGFIYLKKQSSGNNIPAVPNWLGIRDSFETRCTKKNVFSLVIHQFLLNYRTHFFLNLQQLIAKSDGISPKVTLSFSLTAT